ncbi:MAG TPA: DUF6242 domain-containing protein [Candidatus Amulumruptor caecigallinarius]|uniref:DUF6242 domain-containing protein n=1 Tax=Candidatus Amulumruptor caecigallinarius TaxID=2109911 RepID=A0A921E8X3_9BACT|nr:DUF6242 domain-containing protein [Candidatus Amulumruptor caecigallinarius]
MSKYLLVLSLMTVMVLFSTSCNSKSDEEEEGQNVSYTSTVISSFALVEDDEVLRDLETVYFTIDLNNALIYNAQPLPKGTDVSSLAVTIGTGVLSAISISYVDADGVTQTVDYMADSSAKINFAHGPATVTVTSGDGNHTRSYEVSVNVYEVEADLLAWDDTSSAELPTTLGVDNVTAAKAVDFKGQPLVLTSNGNGELCIATCADINNPQWTFVSPVAPAGGVKVNTLAVCGDNLYVVAAGDALLTSADGGQNWVDTGASMSYIYGEYAGRLLGNVKDATGAYSLIDYPGGTAAVLPEGFPVSGTSQMLSYEQLWMESPIGMMIGGTLADGSLTDACWAYDGSTWCNIAVTAAPQRTGVTLVPYFVYRTESTSWVTTKLTAFIAMGGTNPDGSISKEVYVSTDYGTHWLLADDSLQLPDELPSFTSASGLVYSRMMSADQLAAASWEAVASNEMPLWVASNYVKDNEGITPITEWECPYIYLFGGADASGSIDGKIWRGVINRLTFKPLQ